MIAHTICSQLVNDTRTPNENTRLEVARRNFTFLKWFQALNVLSQFFVQFWRNWFEVGHPYEKTVFHSSQRRYTNSAVQQTGHTNMVRQISAFPKKSGQASRHVEFGKKCTQKSPHIRHLCRHSSHTQKKNENHKKVLHTCDGHAKTQQREYYVKQTLRATTTPAEDRQKKTPQKKSNVLSETSMRRKTHKCIHIHCKDNK